MSESKFEEFPYGELGIIAMKNIEGLAKEVDELLMKKNGATESYLLKITESRFSNGEGKVNRSRWTLPRYQKSYLRN